MSFDVKKYSGITWGVLYMGESFSFPPTGRCERSLTCNGLQPRVGCNALHYPCPVPSARFGTRGENGYHFHSCGGVTYCDNRVWLRNPEAHPKRGEC